MIDLRAHVHLLVGRGWEDAKPGTTDGLLLVGWLAPKSTTNSTKPTPLVGSKGQGHH